MRTLFELNLYFVRKDFTYNIQKDYDIEAHYDSKSTKKAGLKTYGI